MQNYKSRLTSYLIPVLSVMVCTSAFARENDGNGNSSPKAGQRGGVLEAQELRPRERDSDWLLKVREVLERDEYKPTLAVDRNGRERLQAPNRANNFRTYFDEEGILIVPREDESPWDLRLSVKKWGWKGMEKPIQRSAASKVNNRIEYNYDGFNEWYINDERGLEIGFTVSEPVEHRYLQHKELSIVINVEGSVSGLSFSDDGAIRITGDSSRQIQLRDLNVWDDLGRPLDASFERNHRGFSITVDVQDAVFPITIDPWIVSTDMVVESDKANAGFGVNANAAGDVNGDGYNDIIISAPEYDGPNSSQGRIFLYYGGGQGVSIPPGWYKDSGSTFRSWWGKSAVGKCDYNGDGFPDVVIGGTDPIQIYNGGLNGLPATPSTMINSIWGTNSAFGGYVECMGDTTGDGFDDLAVSAPNYRMPPDSPVSGLVVVFYGSENGLAISNRTEIFPNIDDVEFGYTLAAAGDVNGDGFQDLLVDSTHVGKVYAYYGSQSGMQAVPSWSYTSLDGASLSQYGNPFAGAGDVNGDGFDDIVLGISNYTYNGERPGAALAFYGSSVGLGQTPDWVTYGELFPPTYTMSKYGYTVAGVGDVDSDGYSDIAVGAPEFSSSEGKIYAYYGGPQGLDFEPAWKTEANLGSEYLGGTLAGLGDVNGDGYDDFTAVGRMTFTQTGNKKVHVYFGSQYGLPWESAYYSAGSQLGFSVAGAGDINQDGFQDIVVGSPYYASNDEGNAAVYFGTANGLGDAAKTHDPTNQASAYYGYAVSGFGDANNNGFYDFVVAAPYYDNTYINAGRVYVYEGQNFSGTGAINPVIIDGDLSGGKFGYSVAWAGDVNNDGYDDLIVGQPFRKNYPANMSNAGRAYVYYGSNTGINTATPTILDVAQANAYFGSSVMGIGDANGDGFTDVAVGAYGYDVQPPSGGTLVDAGRVYVFYGSSSGISSSNFTTIDSDQAGAKFGLALGGGVDIDNDGFSDLIVGTKYHSGALAAQGAVFLYRGAATGVSAVYAWMAESDQSDSGFGFSVAGLGDWNGDGYGDIAVGAPTYSNGQDQEGRVYVYLGEPGGLGTTAEWYSESGMAGAMMGYSLASAGDLNGDGFSDLVVGAKGASNPAAGDGKVYIFYGRECKFDNDTDGLCDDAEIYVHGTDPFNADTDGDGLNDYQEVKQYLTNPLLPDTDNDTLGDGAEVFTYLTNPLSNDTDADGLTDGYEVNTSYSVSPLNTSPLVADTDGDGLNDGYEVNVAQTHPLITDTDGDCISDGDEVNRSHTNPIVADQDIDGDGLTSCFEISLTNETPTDPFVSDTDGDGLSDGSEVNNYGSNPLMVDTDSDGFYDALEVLVGTCTNSQVPILTHKFTYNSRGETIGTATIVTGQ